jgi:hypothetical protein
MNLVIRIVVTLIVILAVHIGGCGFVRRLAEKFPE